MIAGKEKELTFTEYLLCFKNCIKEPLPVLFHSFVIRHNILLSRLIPILQMRKWGHMRIKSQRYRT